MTSRSLNYRSVQGSLGPVQRRDRDRRDARHRGRAGRSPPRLGVNFIDTADSYGSGVSERLIAEALRPYPEELVIATKGGYRRPGLGQWRPDGRPEHLDQEEFYFSLPYEAMALALYARTNGSPPESLAAAIGVPPDGAVRVYADIDSKRRIAEILNLPALIPETPGTTS